MDNLRFKGKFLFRDLKEQLASFFLISTCSKKFIFVLSYFFMLRISLRFQTRAPVAQEELEDLGTYLPLCASQII